MPSRMSSEGLGVVARADGHRDAGPEHVLAHGAHDHDAHDSHAGHDLLHEAGPLGLVQEAHAQLVALDGAPDAQREAGDVVDEQEGDGAEGVAGPAQADAHRGGDHAQRRQEDGVADAGQRAHEGGL